MIKTNYIDGQQYTAADDIAPWKHLLADGVFDVTTGKLAVTANSPADLSVNVAIGAANKNGLFVNSDAVINVPIVANISGYNRIDIIVVDVGVSPVAIKAVTGTGTSSPAAPLPNANQLVLARIFVGNNASAIETAAITDKRVMAKTKQEVLLDDRTIVESGGNDTDGYYTKYGNGDVKFWGIVPLLGSFKTNSTKTINKTLPIVCIEPPIVNMNASMYDGASEFSSFRVSANLNGTNNNGFYGHIHVGFASITQNYIGVHYTATGKWK